MAVLFLTLALVTASADAGVYVLPAVEVPAPAFDDAPLPTSPSVRDATATLTTVDAALARAEAKDAAELLNTTPGLSVQDQGGPGQRKTLVMRGASANAVQVLLDGVPLQGPGGAMDLSRVPTSALEKIEVLRGGASARYGPGAMGGVVNLVTKAPGATRFFGDVTYGSFHTTQLSVGASTPLLGGEALVLLDGLRSEGTFDFRFDDRPALPGNDLLLLRRDNNGVTRGGGLLRYRRALGATQLDVMLEGLADHRGLAGPVQNPSASAWQRTARGTLAARTQTDFAHGGSLATLTFTRVDATTLSGAFFGSGEFGQTELSAGTEATYTHLVGRHGLFGLVSAGVDSLFAAQQHLWGRFGAMVGDDLLLFDGRWTISGSVRLDVAGPFVVFSPKLGTAVELPYGFSLRANAGQASRPPGFQEMYVTQGTLLPNSSLRPERALTADLGVVWTHARARLAVSGFYSLYEDLISYEYYPPNLARPYNFAAAQVAGVEAEGTASPFDWLTLSASYTFTHSQNLRDDPRYYGKPLPFRPEHRAFARVAAGPWFLRGHAEVVFQSLQYTNRTGTLSVPERALLNLGLTATPLRNPRVSVSGELKNLLDVHTYDYDGYPLPPRAFFVTLGFSWEPNSPGDTET